jgi:hypothetical protein
VASLVLLTAVACGSGDSPPAAQGSSTTVTVATTVPPTTVAVARPAVALENAGAQPRQPLALRLTAGSTAKVAMVNKLTLKVAIGGQAAPTGVVPGTRTVITERVDKVGPDGTGTFSVSYSDAAVVPTPGVDPAVAQATQAGIEPMNRVRGTATVSPTGEVTNVAFDSTSFSDPTLKGLLDSMTSQLGSLSAPFPQEPVGAGARWTVTSTATITGMTMTTTTRYTLRSRSGDRYELDTVQDAVAVPGPVAFPGMPAGAQVSVTKFTIKSTGQVSGDLTRHLPTKSSLKGSGEGAFAMTIGSEKVSMTQNMTMDITTSPV